MTAAPERASPPGSSPEQAFTEDEHKRATAALREAFGEELWQLGHPAYVVVHLREELAKVTRLWKEAAVKAEAGQAQLAAFEPVVAALKKAEFALSHTIDRNPGQAYEAKIALPVVREALEAAERAAGGRG